MIQKMHQLVEMFFNESELDDCFICDIKVNKHSRKIEIFIDSDTGINYTICRRVSRAVEGYLDEISYNEGKYVLDVSSPGIGNPLKLKRQYIKNIGRDIEVLTLDDETVKGLLKEVNENDILVFKSKKKKKELIEENIKILFEQIKTAKILTKI